MIRRVVVIGAGHAGGRFCETVRSRGYGGALTLIGDEPHEPYERPPLSKDVLLGQASPGAARIASKSLTDLAIEHIGGRRVVAIDAGQRKVTLDNDRRISYDRLVMATGVRPRAACIPGASLPGVHVLRTADEASALRDAFETAASIVIIGGGFIGLEVAAAATQRGLRVTVLERAANCLSRVLPPASAAVINATHAARGVDVRCGVEVESIDGTACVSSVTLRDGRKFGADLVLLGLGSEPNMELAQTAGLAVPNGVLTDNECRTSNPAVYAIGDVSAQIHGLNAHAARRESVDNAERQAAIAAASILGEAPPAAAAPWFWTDQFGLNVQIIGEPRSSDALIIRTDLDGQLTHHFYHAAGALTGAVLFNVGKDRRVVARLLGRQNTIDLQKLAEPLCDLRTLAA